MTTTITVNRMNALLPLVMIAMRSTPRLPPRPVRTTAEPCHR